MAEDYYKLLGVSKSSSKAEIKKAYKKLAMKYHPDRNKGNKAAEEKFKRINEAYAVLSDDKKKAQYDQFGAEGFSNRFSQEDIFRGFDFGNIFGNSGFGNDMFSSIFGNNGGSRTQGNPFSFNFGDGGSPFGSASQAQGRGCSSGSCAPKEKPAETDLSITIHEAFNGVKKNISFNFGQGIDKIVLHVPAGIEDGQKLKLKGKGKISPMTGGRGDLYVKIKILPDAYFKREGKDLVIEQDILMTGLILGTSVTISTIDSKKIELKVPPFSTNNAVMRIKGKGFPNGKTGPGNLLVRLSAALPKELTDQQKKLVEELAKTGL